MYSKSTKYSKFEYTTFQFEYKVFNLSTMYSKLSTRYSNLSTLFSKFEYNLFQEYNIFENWVQCIPIEYNVLQFEYIVFTIWVQCIATVHCIRNCIHNSKSTMYSKLEYNVFNLRTIYSNLSTLFSYFEYNVFQDYNVFEIWVQYNSNLSRKYSIWVQWFQSWVQCIPIWVHCIHNLRTMYSKSKMYSKFEYNVFQFEYNEFQFEYNLLQFEYIVFTIWVQCIPRV